MDFYPYIQSNFTTCPKERNLTFTIFPEGLEEKVRVDVEHVCDCDCQLEPEAVDLTRDLPRVVLPPCESIYFCPPCSVNKIT